MSVQSLTTCQSPWMLNPPRRARWLNHMLTLNNHERFLFPSLYLLVMLIHTSQCISFSIYGPDTGGFCPSAMVQLMWAHWVL